MFMAFDRIDGWTDCIFDWLIYVDDIIDGWCFTRADGFDDDIDGYLDT